MIVYVENPQPAGMSHCLRNPPEEQIESEFEPKFEETFNLQEVKNRLIHMENNGLHIRNGRDMVFRSYDMMKVIESIEKHEWYIPHLMRYLTRTCNLRSVVYFHLTGSLVGVEGIQ